jgi:N-acetylglucosamine malate deacetylase 1
MIWQNLVMAILLGANIKTVVKTVFKPAAQTAAQTTIAVFRRLLYRLQAWNANFISAQLRRRQPEFLLTPAPLLVFAPHQDDESLGCGGLIALKQSTTAPIRVIFLPDGGFVLGQPPRPEHSQRRQQEALQALAILGVDRDQVTFLNYPDGHLSTLSITQHQELIAQLVHVLQSYPGADVMVPHAADRHPDHEATCALVQTAIQTAIQTAAQDPAIPKNTSYQLWQYPIWLFWKKAFPHCLRQQPQQDWHQLPISPVIKQKIQAIAAHQSQVATLPPGFLHRFEQPYELYAQYKNPSHTSPSYKSPSTF